MRTAYRSALFLGALVLAQQVQIQRWGMFLGGGQADALLIGGQHRGERAEVTASRLRVHSGPGLNYRTIGSLPRGTSLTVLESRARWSRVKAASGTTGWVAGEYLKLRSGPRGATPSGGALARRNWNLIVARPYRLRNGSRLSVGAEMVATAKESRRGGVTYLVNGSWIPAREVWEVLSAGRFRGTTRSSTSIWSIHWKRLKRLAPRVSVEVLRKVQGHPDQLYQVRHGGVTGWVAAKAIRLGPSLGPAVQRREPARQASGTNAQFRKVVVKPKDVQYRRKEIRVRTYNVSSRTARYRVYYDFGKAEFRQKVGSTRVSQPIALAVQIVETTRFLICVRGFKKVAILHTGRILRKLPLDATGGQRHAVQIVRTLTLRPEWLRHQGQTTTATLPGKRRGSRTTLLTRYRFQKSEIQRAQGRSHGPFKLKVKLYKSNAEYTCRGNTGTIEEVHQAHVVFGDKPGKRIEVVAPTAPKLPTPTNRTADRRQAPPRKVTRWSGFQAKIIRVKRSGSYFYLTINAGYRSGIFDFSDIYLLAGDTNRVFKLRQGRKAWSVNWQCTEISANECTGRIKLNQNVFASNRRVGVLRGAPSLRKLQRGKIYQYGAIRSSPGWQEVRVNRGKDVGLHRGSLIYLLRSDGRALLKEDGRPVVFSLDWVLNTKSLGQTRLGYDVLKPNGPVAFRGHGRRTLPEGPDFDELAPKTQARRQTRPSPRSRPAPKKCFGVAVDSLPGLLGRMTKEYVDYDKRGREFRWLRKNMWVKLYGKTDKHYYVRNSRGRSGCVRKQDVETRFLYRQGGIIGTVMDVGEAAWEGVKSFASCVRKGALGCVVRLLLKAIDAGCGALAKAVTRVAAFFRGPFDTLLALVSERARRFIAAKERCAGQFARGAFCGMLDTIKTGTEIAIGVAKEIIDHPKACLIAGITTLGPGAIACGLIYYLKKAVTTAVHTFQCLANRGELLKTLVGAVFEAGCYVAGSEFRNWALTVLTGGTTLPITLMNTLKLVLKKIGKGLLKAHKVVSFAHALHIHKQAGEVALETIIGTAERTLHSAHQVCR